MMGIPLVDQLSDHTNRYFRANRVLVEAVVAAAFERVSNGSPRTHLTDDGNP
jgi:hypothetical protein